MSGFSVPGGEIWILVTAEITVGGKRLQSRCGVDAEAWADKGVREGVVASLKAHLVEALLVELDPKIEVRTAP